MRISEIQDRAPALVEKLVKIWEGSVKATHLFLSAAEIENIKAYVPQALQQVPLLLVIENEDGEPAGFMGIAERYLEMLFIAAEARNGGLGKKLLCYGI